MTETITEVKKQRVQLSDHFTYKKLMQFTWPMIIMSVMMSVFYAVDGFLVSRFAGSTALAAMNLMMPIIMIMGTVGFMLGVGGAALVGKVLGEKKPELANEYFSLFTYASIVLGVVMTLLGMLLMPASARFMGATGDYYHLCVVYSIIALAGMPPYILQFHFQVFFATAEKAKIGMWFNIAAGIVHIIFDWILIVVLNMGLIGGGIAMDLGEVVGGLGPLIYFIRENDSLLRLGRTRWHGRAILKALTNGLSEFLMNIAFSVQGVVVNFELMRFVGQDGVAAYGIIMYFSGIFTALFWGYGGGVSPIFSYHYGAQNRAELKNLLKRSFFIFLWTGAVMAVFAYVLARPLGMLYLGEPGPLLDMSTEGFKLYAISCIFMGVGSFGSTLFTALNNGIVSGIIALLRILVCQTGSVVVLAELAGLEGIWWSFVVGQFLSLVTTVVFVFAYRKRYGYL